MGAVGKQGILICTKMQLSFATGRRLQGSAGGGAKGGEGAGSALRSGTAAGAMGGGNHLQTRAFWSSRAWESGGRDEKKN